jgi:hypothetical protein
MGSPSRSPVLQSNSDAYVYDADLPERRSRYVPSRRGHDLKGKAERRNLVTRMVVRVSQLRQAIQLLRFVCGALIDSGIQVDQMLAGFAGCREVDDHVPLAVKSTGIAHVGVVVGRRVDVVIFGPADTLEVNRYGRARWSRLRCDADDAGFDDEEGTRCQAIAVPQRKSVQTTEVVWNRHRPFEPSVASYLNLREVLILRLEP